MALLLMSYSPGHPKLIHLTLVSRDSTASSHSQLSGKEVGWDGAGAREEEEKVFHFIVFL